MTNMMFTPVALRKFRQGGQLTANDMQPAAGAYDVALDASGLELTQASKDAIAGRKWGADDLDAIVVRGE
jgi:hypothetical protein